MTAVAVESFDDAREVFGSAMAFLLFLSVAMKVASFPLSRWANRGMIENQSNLDSLGPELAAIRANYRGEEQAEKVLALYKKSGYNPYLPLKSSLVLLAQIPVFVWVYIGVSGSSKVQGEHFGLIQDVSQPDGLLALGTFAMNVLPFIMFLVAIGNLFHISHLKRMDKSQKISGWVIAVGFLVLLYPAPSALVLYWTLNIAFQWIVDVVVVWWHAKERLPK